MSYSSVSTSFYTALTPPLRVLVKSGNKGFGGGDSTNRKASSVAVLPYNEKVFDVLLLDGVDASFIPSTQFDAQEYFNLADCYGCLGVIAQKSGLIISFRPLFRFSFFFFSDFQFSFLFFFFSFFLQRTVHWDCDLGADCGGT